MTKPLSILNAGPVAPALKQLLDQLDTNGARGKFFMSDLIDTLKYEECFLEELNSLQADVIFGDYFKHCISNEKANLEPKDSSFLEITTMACTRVAKYLHTTLVTQGHYAIDGTFPYEFHSFDGRLIFLRSL